MELNKTETENLLSMLNSSDRDNYYVALKAIDAHEFDDSTVGFLLYLYKFSKCTYAKWKEEAPKSTVILEKLLRGLSDEPLTYSRALTVMINKRVNKDSIEMFLERHVKELVTQLENIGYPTEKLDLSIKLKERE
jgi:hypothetical protein